MGKEPRPPEKISVDVRGIQVTIALPALAGGASDTATSTEEAALAARLGFPLFSPLECRLLACLCAKPTLSRDEISRELSENPEGDLKVLLRHLVHRGVLVSSTNGYSLACPAGVAWGDRARQLLGCLDSGVLEKTT